MAWKIQGCNVQVVRKAVNIVLTFFSDNEQCALTITSHSDLMWKVCERMSGLSSDEVCNESIPDRTGNCRIPNVSFHPSSSII